MKRILLIILALIVILLAAGWVTITFFPEKIIPYIINLQVERLNQTPDFFEDDVLDPVEAATGYGNPSHQPGSGPQGGSGKAGDKSVSLPNKKKAGFYLSSEILERFNLKFYELKLAGVTIENKSNLLELALAYALDDIDKGRKSRILQKIGSR